VASNGYVLNTDGGNGLEARMLSPREADRLFEAGTRYVESVEGDALAAVQAIL
jgi:hypothetical protein